MVRAHLPEHFGENLIKGRVGSLHGHRRNTLQGAGGEPSKDLAVGQNTLVRTLWRNIDLRVGRQLAWTQKEHFAGGRGRLEGPPKGISE